MKFVVSQESLLGELQFLQEVAEKKKTVPILSNIFLRAEGDFLILVAGEPAHARDVENWNKQHPELPAKTFEEVLAHIDAGNVKLGGEVSETEIESESVRVVEAQVKEPGEIAISAKKIIEVVRSLTDEKISFALTDGSWLEITCGNSFFCLVGAATVIVEEISQIFNKHRLPLETVQAQKFAVYLALLERWNAAINITSIRDRHIAIERHFAEPAMAMSLLGGAGPNILCAGSGGGFPGLPFKILDAGRECLLVEANNKKVSFMREVVDALELEDARVIEGRFEEKLACGELEPASVHVLTSRAWTGWSGLLGLGSSLMVPGGRAIIFVGEETLRALRRYLSAGALDVRATPDPEWGPAVHAGWTIRRILNLPHLDNGYAVSLEIPQD